LRKVQAQKTNDWRKWRGQQAIIGMEAIRPGVQLQRHGRGCVEIDVQKHPAIP
jgi:hypothetical protein